MLLLEAAPAEWPGTGQAAKGNVAKWDSTHTAGKPHSYECARLCRLPWEDRSHRPSWPWPVVVSRPPAWGPQPAEWAQPPTQGAQPNTPPVNAACPPGGDLEAEARTMVLLLLRTSYSLSSSKAHGHQGPHSRLTRLPAGPLGQPRPPQPVAPGSGVGPGSMDRGPV